jgi:hypothetical protein
VGQGDGSSVGQGDGTTVYVKNMLRNFWSADTSSDLAVLLSAEFKFVNNLKEGTQNRSILNVFFRMEHIPYDISLYISNRSWSLT